MEMIVQAMFVDPSTQERYVVRSGLDGRKFGLFRIKPNGSLKRVKSPDTPMDPSPSSAVRRARDYATKKGWREVAG